MEVSELLADELTEDCAVLVAVDPTVDVTELVMVLEADVLSELVPVELAVKLTEDDTVLCWVAVSVVVALLDTDVVGDDVPVLLAVLVPDVVQLEAPVAVPVVLQLVLAVVVSDVVAELVAVLTTVVVGEVTKHSRNAPALVRSMTLFSAEAKSSHSSRPTCSALNSRQLRAKDAPGNCVISVTMYWTAVAISSHSASEEPPSRTFPRLLVHCTGGTL